MLEKAILTLLQWTVGFLAAPILAGFIKKVKARLQHRQGPPILQPWNDLRKLFGKKMVLSEVTSWVFQVPPYLEFGVGLLLLLAVPGPFLFAQSLNPGIDIIFVLYLWGLARFFTALAGLDGGSAFGGMGSSREMTIAALVEPGLLLLLFILGIKATTLNVNRIFLWAAQTGEWFFSPLYLMTTVAFFILLIAETGRIPVDNPDTHLELTMIHEGMILEYSGPYLALISWAVMIRQYLYYGIFLNIFFPGAPPAHYGIASTAIGILVFGIKTALLGVVVALVESLLAKMRLLKLPRLLWGAAGMAILAVFTLVY